MVSGRLELEGEVDDDICIGVGMGKWAVRTVRQAPEPKGVSGAVDAGVALVDERDGAVEEDGAGDGGWETRTRGVDVGGLAGRGRGGRMRRLAIRRPMAIIASPTSRGSPRIVTAREADGPTCEDTLTFAWE